MLAGGLLGAGVVLLEMELPINGAADLWIGLCVVLAAATWINAAPAPPAAGAGPAPARRS